MTTPRTFCTFPREFSSFRRPGATRRATLSPDTSLDLSAAGGFSPTNEWSRRALARESARLIRSIRLPFLKAKADSHSGLSLLSKR